MANAYGIKTGKTQVGCWLDKSEVGWLKGAIDHLQGRRPGKVTMSDIIRDLIRRAREEDVYGQESSS